MTTSNNNLYRTTAHLQDRGRSAGFKDWLATTVCFFLCCFGCCRPDTSPQRGESQESPNTRKLSASMATTAQKSGKGKVKTHDDSLKALAAAVQGAKKDDIEINA